MEFNKNKIRVIRKINKFFERHKVAYFQKVSKEIADDKDFIDSYINKSFKSSYKNHKNIKNLSYEIGQDGLDFVRMTKTIRIEFTCSKYGNL